MIVDESSEVPLEFRDDMVSYTSSFIFLQKKSTAILGRKKNELLYKTPWALYMKLVFWYDSESHGISPYFNVEWK